jgi:hypothetical protein
MTLTNAALTATTDGVIHTGDLIVTIGEGWNRIGVSIEHDGTNMIGEAWVTGDEGILYNAAPQIIAPGVIWVDHESYISCIGAKWSGGDGTDGFAGIIRSV